MPRRKPGRLRTTDSEASRRAEQLGLAPVTARALERLGQPGLDPVTVAENLATWRDVTALPASVLAGPHNDWTGFIGPLARSVLEDALTALNKRNARPLRLEVERLDAAFIRKTSHDPRSDAGQPWWFRRASP